MKLSLNNTAGHMQMFCSTTIYKVYLAKRFFKKASGLIRQCVVVVKSLVSFAALTCYMLHLVCLICSPYMLSETSFAGLQRYMLIRQCNPYVCLLCSQPLHACSLLQFIVCSCYIGYMLATTSLSTKDRVGGRV